MPGKTSEEKKSMNQKEYNENIETSWDWIDEQQALTRISPSYLRDIVDDDIEDARDILIQNGMFRNRDPPDLSKPISGSNADQPDCPGELAEYEQAIEEWINTDQMQTLKDAFPKDSKNICPVCNSPDIEESWGSAGYMQCNSCGIEY